mmetsp:Transcript_58150/g.152881  ORF Transcript_58150/g.152881 Transcript_58150/m.152881 type:complete len:109 (+) Transcript_58150:400-726(+)
MPYSATTSNQIAFVTPLSATVPPSAPGHSFFFCLFVTHFRLRDVRFIHTLQIAQSEPCLSCAGPTAQIGGELAHDGSSPSQANEMSPVCNGGGGQSQSDGFNGGGEGI